MSKIAVIGSGISGLSAACYLAAAGHQVDVYEKNDRPGGRARQFSTPEGFVFDMGPSWYWMPDVFERFFNDFGKKTSDYYHLHKLQPAFDVYFGQDDFMHVPQDFSELCLLFESIEPGSGSRLVSFMKEAEFKYNTGINDLVYKPGLSLTEFADPKLLSGMLRLQVFSSFSKHIRKYFSHPKLLALMEFPVLFLGAMPEKTPALYSLMNYAGLQLGTWYPQGGFGKVIEGFVGLAKELGVAFHFNSNVEKIMESKGRVHALKVNGELIACEGLIASADYNHVEKILLGPELKNYDESYWEKKTFAPSCLIYYLGLKRKVANMNHHTLFFDEPLGPHAVEIYQNPKWPAKPLFYVCCPSKTDNTVAPSGHENLFFLMPIAPGLQDDEATREKYFTLMVARIKEAFGTDILPDIIYKKSYCVSDFIADYNSYKGNAYGLANTLMQTAILKPKIKNFKIGNMFYTGQLTVPGPGVPPSIISGKVAAQLLLKNLKSKKHASTF